MIQRESEIRKEGWIFWEERDVRGKRVYLGLYIEKLTCQLVCKIFMHEIIEDQIKYRMGMRGHWMQLNSFLSKGRNIIKKQNMKNDDETDWTWESWVTLSSQYNILFWIYSTVRCGVWK